MYNVLLVSGIQYSDSDIYIGFPVGSGSKVYSNQSRLFLTLPIKPLCWNSSRSSVFFFVCLFCFVLHKSPNLGFPSGFNGKEFV